MLRFRWEKEFKDIRIKELNIPNDYNHYIIAKGVYGKIPKGWEIKSIDEDYNVNTGERVSPIVEGPYPVYGSSGFSGFSKVFLIDHEAVITGRVGSLGLVSFTEGKVNISDNALYVTKKNENAVTKFLYYSMTLIFKNIEEVLNCGTSQPLLKQSEVRKFSVPFPDYAEQHRIVNILSSLDNLIDNKNRQNEILEKIAIAIFKDWFVDFEPFKDEEFVNSRLGDIPNGWEAKPIGEISDLKQGYSYLGKEKHSEALDGSHIFITLNNIAEGGGFKPEYTWIRSDKLRDRHFLEEGDLIIANIHFGVGGSDTGRLFATPALVIFPENYEQQKGVYSMDITRISPFEKEYRFFLYLYLKLTREDSVSFSTGTSILHLHTENFKKNKMVIYPPKPILEKFVKLVEPLFQKITTNKKQILVLTKIKDILLPLLVFGKLRVEET